MLASNDAPNKREMLNIRINPRSEALLIVLPPRRAERIAPISSWMPHGWRQKKRYLTEYSSR